MTWIFLGNDFGWNTSTISRQNTDPLSWKVFVIKITKHPEQRQPDQRSRSTYEFVYIFFPYLKKLKNGLDWQPNCLKSCKF